MKFSELNYLELLAIERNMQTVLEAVKYERRKREENANWKLYEDMLEKKKVNL